MTILAYQIFPGLFSAQLGNSNVRSVDTNEPGFRERGQMDLFAVPVVNL